MVVGFAVTSRECRSNIFPYDICEANYADERLSGNVEGIIIARNSQASIMNVDNGTARHRSN